MKSLLPMMVATASAQLSKVIIRNDCNDPDFPYLWVGNQGHSSSYVCPQMDRLAYTDEATFTAPEAGAPSYKFWTMAQCGDGTGTCTYGQSIWGTSGFVNPQFPYNTRGAMPPINTGFEISFGCSYNDTTLCADNPAAAGTKLTNEDYYDITSVDGVTNPMTVDVDDPNNHCDVAAGLHLDTTSFNFDVCKSFTWVRQSDGSSHTLDLRVIDIHGTVLGCASPCQRLTQEIGSWFVDDAAGQALGLPLQPSDPDAEFYCCEGAAKVSSVCSAGFTLSNGAQYQPFKVPNSYYTILEAMNVYSQPFSDNIQFNPSPVLFKCNQGGLTYTVNLKCPQKLTAPAPAIAPLSAWVGVQYAKAHFMVVPPNTCWFNVTQHNDGEAQAQNCPGPVPCGDCRTYADPVDILHGGTIFQCVCPPNAWVTPVPNPPVPMWKNPAICLPTPPPTPPTPPVVMAFYSLPQTNLCYDDGKHKETDLLHETRSDCCNHHNDDELDAETCESHQPEQWYPNWVEGTCVMDAKYESWNRRKLYEPSVDGKKDCCRGNFHWKYQECMGEDYCEDPAWYPDLVEGRCIYGTNFPFWLKGRTQRKKRCCRRFFNYKLTECLADGDEL